MVMETALSKKHEIRRIKDDFLNDLYLAKAIYKKPSY